MCFLQWLRKLNLQKMMMVCFYIAITEFILTSSITIWYAVVPAWDKGRLQHIITSAVWVI